MLKSSPYLMNGPRIISVRVAEILAINILTHQDFEVVVVVTCVFRHFVNTTQQ